MRTELSASLALTSILHQPILVALFAGMLSALGLRYLSGESSGIVKYGSNPGSGKSTSKKTVNPHRRNYIYTSLSTSTITVLVLIWTKSIFISAPFAAFSAVIGWNYFRRRSLRQNESMLQVWPEVIDHLISGIQSGLSLTEALVGLGTRGPEIVRPHFLLFRQELLERGDFVEAAEVLKHRFDSHGSDQILEAILLAKSLGGSELLQIFRTLGDFLRQDLALRKEIEIKHGWIKNSAHLSSAAPWLLLLLLSTQPGTVEAFSEPVGIAILFVGVLLTSVAYLWMGRLGRLPESARVFK